MGLYRWQLSDVCVVAKSIAKELGYGASTFYRSTSYDGDFILQYSSIEVTKEVVAFLSISGINCILEKWNYYENSYSYYIRLYFMQPMTSLDYARI